ncbi:PTS transporter subunit EIIC [Ignavigranum ruoffiae]|uniref:PTS system IIB component, Glc family /PTS system IIC component, Glc family n=1 Tax=Ignavigranum ruoffiae TaxID=89093 RepID=A0A1H9F589_9LACT|nr:PTS transporter subunit EIIC [Ignavigranum ruoffiae]UPQ85988.1 PTS transporter subunit EIIC [Ignavigranum ruoffiae]SEQ33092.1 PTS system IIB component, Glc family /PTS system IIC component, Glc family [Ignavigranum ruoffiae]
MSKEKMMADQIAERIGGLTNTSKVYNCMTRVRIDLNDPSQVDVEALKAIDGVLGVVEDGNNLQIIVGPGASTKVATALNDLRGVSHTEQIQENLDPELTQSNDVSQRAASNKADFKAKQKDNGFKRFTRIIASIFVPLIPAFVGAGIIGGIASIIQNLITSGNISAENWGQILLVLKIIQSGLFAYLNIYVGINAAKVFGATEGLGGVVAGVIYLTGMAPEAPLMNIFSGQPLSPGQGGIIGVIFAVYLLSIVEKWLRKVIPNSLDIIVTPTIALLITGLITIFLIMPLAGVISTSLVGTVNKVLEVGGAVAGFILGATFLPLVMFGLHQILTPVHIEMISSTGATNLLPILAMAGAGQVGAAIALWIKARKNQQLASMIKGALPVGILGIGEPLIYAVTLPLGRPFITACLGGGVGGAVIGALGNIGATAIGPSGVALIPLIANGRWLGYVFGLLAAYAGGFVLTYLFGVPHEATLATELHGSSSNLDVNEMLNNL